MSESDLDALERFVVDNDDLLELEATVGRFNVFDALRIERMEIRHSNFLAWLLDPSESHGQSDLFLRPVLMDILKAAPRDKRCISPADLDGVELSGVEVRREWRNIDLLIICERPRLVVLIENKVDADESLGQLEKYAATVAQSFQGFDILQVFLTPDGHEASESNWVPYSYAALHRVLTRIMRTGERSIGPDIRIFLEHYLGLIGGKFMSDPKVDELCRRIYKNHRQALKLIFDRVGTPASGLIGAIEAHLGSRASGIDWHIFGVDSRAVSFVPAAWLPNIRPICSLPNVDPRFWVRMWFIAFRTNGRLAFELGPATDAAFRERMIGMLTGPGSGTGLKAPKRITPTWTRLWSRTVGEWEEGDEPDVEAVMKQFAQELGALVSSVSGVPGILARLGKGSSA